MTLQLRPGLHRLWRRPGRLQIGLDARHGVVLDGLTPADEYLLDDLAEGVAPAALVGHGRALGVPEARVHALVAELRASGVLLSARTVRSQLARLPGPLRSRLAPDATTLGVAYPGGDGWHVLAERRTRCVAVVGAGRTGLAIATSVAAAGVGCVLVEDDAPVRPGDLSPGGYRTDDVGRARAGAAREVLAEHCPHTRTQLWGRALPDVVALVGHGVVDPVRADGLLREDVPHLAVVFGERDVVVGPLVRPGQSSCLRCGHLHRTDRDPEWPRLAAQLATPGRGTPPPREESVLASCAAALAVAAVLAQLDGATPAVLDAALEVGLPDGAVARRAWPPHPACGCRGLPQVAPAAANGTMAR